MKHRRAVVAFLMAVLLFAAPSVFAQWTEGNVSGTVEDPSGAAVPGAKVTVTNQATGTKNETQTDNIGYFRVQHIVPGKYEVRVEAPKFKVAVLHDVVVNVNATTRADVRLEIGGATESVEVRGANVLVQAEEARLAATVGTREITELPLNGREIYQLMNLQPGVTATNAPVISNVPSTNSPVTFDFGFVSNGSTPRGNNFTLDGTSNNNEWLGGTPVVFPSVDAIEEFQVQTLNFSAEYGRNNGAVANVVTKSGTNNLHGSLYYFHRNTALNARNYFDLPNEKAPLLAHQFGVSVGGPIRKDKTFFFGNYEGARRTDGEPERVTVETPEFRVLVASSRPGSIANQFLRDFPAPPCIAGTSIDAGSIPAPGNPLLVGPLDGIPDICTAGAQQVQNHKADQYLVRIDHNLSDASKVFARWIANYGSADVSRQELLNANMRGFRAPLTGFFADLALGWTQQLSPRWLNDFRFSYNRNNSTISYEVPSGASEQQLQAAGTPNFFAHLRLDDGCSGFGQPSCAVIPFGGPVFIPRTFVFNTFTAADSMNRQVGRHALKWGGEVRRIQENSNYELETHPYYIFTSLFNFANDQPWLVESLVNRDPSSPNFGQFTDTPRNFRRTQWALFFQDDWKVTSHLSLNLGLRYEVFGSPTETKGRLSNIILGSGTTIFDQIASARAGRVLELWHADRNNFAPRVGLAWDPFGQGKTVIRSGFSVAYLEPYSNLYTNASRFDPPESSFIDSFPVFFVGTDVNYTFPFKPSPDNFSAVTPSGGAAVGKVGMSGTFPDLRTAYSMQWFLGWQQQFMHDFAVSLNYVGTRGIGLYIREDWNRFRGDICNATTCDFVENRLNPDWGQIFYISNGSNSTYHGMNVQLRKQYSHGLMFTANYTFGKILDLVTDGGLGDYFNVNSSGLVYSGTQDVANRRADRGPSEFDVRHRFTVTALWNLPSPKSASGVAKAVLGGWQFNTIVALQSGRPFDVFCGKRWFEGCDWNMDALTYDRPNRPSSVRFSGFSNQDFVNGVFGVSDFCPGGLVPFYLGTPCVPVGVDGNLSRNAFRGPGYADVDFAIFKNTNITEKVKAQFRTEMFNVFNRTNLYQPASDLGSSLFGKSTQAFAARQIQFGLKFLF